MVVSVHHAQNQVPMVDSITLVAGRRRKKTKK